VEQKNTPAGGRPGTGKSGESNHPYNTTLWSRLQAVDAFFLPLLFIVERVVREVLA
jgi:hypothetical protein